MNVLVTGSSGQLGSEIRNVANLYEQFNFLFPDSLELDISKIDSVLNFFDKNKIDVVINCAAYTNVDKAEKELELAKNINSKGVVNLVKGVEKVNGKMIHISTDYVFDGSQNIPYKETDIVNPIGVYGVTKREGELAILNSNIEAIIVRTSWLYSNFGNNFVKTILNLGKEKSELKIISDQMGSPTFAGDLAIVCLDILSKVKNRIDEKGKIYHYSNEGEISWYDFGKEIIEIGNLDCKVFPIETKNYPTLAKRPQYSVLSIEKIEKDFEIKIPHWRNSLVKCIDILNSN